MTSWGPPWGSEQHSSGVFIRMLRNAFSCEQITRTVFLSVLFFFTWLLVPPRLNILVKDARKGNSRDYSSTYPQMDCPEWSASRGIGNNTIQPWELSHLDRRERSIFKTFPKKYPRNLSTETPSKAHLTENSTNLGTSRWKYNFEHSIIHILTRKLTKVLSDSLLNGTKLKHIERATVIVNTNKDSTAFKMIPKRHFYQSFTYTLH